MPGPEDVARRRFRPWARWKRDVASREDVVADDRWLVVGLGNPGDRYAHTRHNVGADAVALLAEREHQSLSGNKKVRCRLAELTVDGVRLVVVVPDSYMNNSGGPTQAAAAWFKVPVDRIVVCHDDLDVEPGAIKVKQGGGNAGHNGLKDIERALGSPDFLRIRIGIGRPPGRMPGKDFVLRRFTGDERAVVDDALEAAAEAAVSVATAGLEPTQNRFHGRG